MKSHKKPPKATKSHQKPPKATKSHPKPPEPTEHLLSHNILWMKEHCLLHSIFKKYYFLKSNSDSERGLWADTRSNRSQIRKQKINSWQVLDSSFGNNTWSIVFGKIQISVFPLLNVWAPWFFYYSNQLIELNPMLWRLSQNSIPGQKYSCTVKWFLV